MKFNKIRGRIADDLELPNHVVTDNFDLRLQGNKRAIIENHVGILIYENELIQIKTKTNHVILKGENLKIAEITDYNIVINGVINEIQFKE